MINALSGKGPRTCVNPLRGVDLFQMIYSSFIVSYCGCVNLVLLTVNGLWFSIWMGDDKLCRCHGVDHQSQLSLPSLQGTGLPIWS